MNCPFSNKTCDLLKNIHVTDIEDGKVNTKSVCIDCLLIKEKKIPKLAQEFLQVLEEKKKTAASKDSPPCPKCGLTYQQIIKRKKVGCDQCYSFLENYLIPMIENVQQGRTIHIGKFPKSRKDVFSIALIIKYKMMFLQDRMQIVIKREKYETAAELKNCIEQLAGLLNEIMEIRAEYAEAQKQNDYNWILLLKNDLKDIEDEFKLLDDFSLSIP